jgi:hypothetical protein
MADRRGLSCSSGFCWTVVFFGAATAFSAAVFRGALGFLAVVLVVVDFVGIK